MLKYSSTRTLKRATVAKSSDLCSVESGSDLGFACFRAFISDVA